MMIFDPFYLLPQLFLDHYGGVTLTLPLDKRSVHCVCDIKANLRDNNNTK